MNRLFRTIGGVLAIAVPSGVMAVGVAGPAGAATSVTCTKVTGNVNTGLIISKCTPEPGKAAKLSIPASDFNNSQGTYTWNWQGGHTASMFGSSSALQPTGETGCKNAATAEAIALSADGDPTGTLSGSNYGDSTTIVLCVKTSTGAVKLYPGTNADWI